MRPVCSKAEAQAALNSATAELNRAQARLDVARAAFETAIAAVSPGLLIRSCRAELGAHLHGASLASNHLQRQKEQ